MTGLTDEMRSDFRVMKVICILMFIFCLYGLLYVRVGFSVVFLTYLT